MRAISCCLLTAVAAAQDDGRLTRALETVDRLAASELARHDIAGCTVGVVVGPKLVWAKSYGLADIEDERPARNDHLYRIGSITKQITGLVLLQLAAGGTVRLTDPVTKHLPEFELVRGRQEGWPEITLFQLATMTSGLAREPASVREFVSGPVSSWEDVLVRALRRTRVDREPGTRYRYSNIGYGALGAACARAAGKPYVAYVRAKILQPLGMPDTVFEPNERTLSRIATGYTLRGGRPDPAQPRREHAGRGYKVPNGALYTTVADLAKFVSFELGHGPESVLPRRAVAANFARLGTATGSLTSGYGIGFMARRTGELVMHGHGGSVAGYNAAAWIHRPTESGVIVLRNVSGGRFRTGALCQRALAAVARR